MSYVTKFDILVASTIVGVVAAPFLAILLPGAERSAAPTEPVRAEQAQESGSTIQAAAIVEQRGSERAAEAHSSPESPQSPTQSSLSDVAPRKAALGEPLTSESLPDSGRPLSAAAMAGGDLAAALPPAERAEFEEAVNEGRALLNVVGDGKIPAYGCRVELSLLDRLVRNGLARLVVESGPPVRLFLVEARSLNAPERVRLIAGPNDLAGFSPRVVWLGEGDLPGLRRAVSNDFGFSVTALRAGFVLRADLDAAVLRAQFRAVRAAGLTLDDLVFTDGRFATAAGLPFRYRVTRLATRDQRWIAGPDAGSDAAFPGRARQGG